MSMSTSTRPSVNTRVHFRAIVAGVEPVRRFLQMLGAEPNAFMLPLDANVLVAPQVAMRSHQSAKAWARRALRFLCFAGWLSAGVASAWQQQSQIWRRLLFQGVPHLWGFPPDSSQNSRHGFRMGQGLQCASLATFPFEPQQMPRSRRQPWFEGWFVRIIDHDVGFSAAVVLGSVRRRGEEDRTSFSEHLLVLAYREANGRTSDHSLLLPGNAVQIRGGQQLPHAGNVSAEKLTRPHMAWLSSSNGGVQSSGANTLIDLRFPGGVRLFANISAPRVPWDRHRPDEAGPEGWLASTGLLPCHYFVHSFSSPTFYTLHRSHTDRPLASSVAATAHLERNYGAAFPTGWVWAQASAPRNEAHLVLAGGRFVIGPLPTYSYVIGFRAPAHRLSWDFRTTDLDAISDQKDACNGVLAINATSRGGRHHLSLFFTAPPATFGEPIAVPTPDGFSSDPGCRESYAATAHVRAWTSSGGRGEHEQLHLSIPLAVLEFGGSFQCKT